MDDPCAFAVFGGPITRPQSEQAPTASGLRSFSILRVTAIAPVEVFMSLRRSSKISPSRIPANAASTTKSRSRSGMWSTIVAISSTGEGFWSFWTRAVEALAMRTGLRSISSSSSAAAMIERRRR